jgi:hypothetical protein
LTIHGDSDHCRNTRRAFLAECALTGYAQDGKIEYDSQEKLIISLLADIRHLCDLQGYNNAVLMTKAMALYQDHAKHKGEHCYVKSVQLNEEE